MTRPAPEALAAVPQLVPFRPEVDEAGEGVVDPGLEPRTIVVRHLGFVGTCANLTAWGSALFVGDPLGMVTLPVLSAVTLTMFFCGKSDRAATWLGHLFLAVLYLVVTSLALFDGGGLGAPSLILLPSLPAVGAMLYGRWNVFFWSSMCVVTVIGIAAYGANDPAERFPTESIMLLRAVCLCVAAAFISLSALSYNAGMRRRALRIESSHRLAVEARIEAEAATARAISANQSKSRFLATVSHDLRTPLTAVVGIASYLLREDLSPRQLEAVQTLSSSSETLLALIDDLLDLARAESGMLKLSTDPVDLREVCKEVMALFAVRAEQKGLSLEHRLEGPSAVLTDPIRLRQVLFNLVGNAVKYTESGRVVLEVSCTPGQEDEQCAVTVVVRDTGVGIPAESQDRIFDSFTQLQPHAEGSGLGLGIVLQIVRAMEGTIDVESTPGVGSTFTVRLTVPRASVPEERVEHVPLARPLRVLVADDNALNRAVLELMLEDLSCEVTSADNGAEALSALTGRSVFDLVLMDCRMPVMDGCSATRAVRNAGVKTPIIALTADATPEVRRTCMDAGMNDFVTKPITQGQLERLLASQPLTLAK